MPVPNTITRMINKEGKVVTFEISKVHNAITKAIIDVENTSSWEAKERALKYAELVKDRIYRNFYDIQHLTQFFARMIISFGSNEIEERLHREEFAPRLVTLFYLHFTYERKIDQLTSEHQAAVIEFIEGTFINYIENISLLKLVANIFSKKVYMKQEKGLTAYDQYPCRDFIQDMIEQQLKDIGEVFVAEGFMVFREGKKKIKNHEISEAQFTHDGIHRDRLRKSLLWNIQNECDSVFSLNQWVLGRNGKSFQELMERSDRRFYNDIVEVAEKIIKRIESLKVVIIAGPSCSNKTTITTIIQKELAKRGLRLKQLNIDDYFLNLSEHPKDEFGDYDFEMPEALDIPLLNDHLRELIQGKIIERPNYNFKKGYRDGYTEFSVNKDEIILIDCLHGLYKSLTEAVPKERKFKIYTESSNTLRNIDGAYTKWTDVRLAKRMIRDSLYRGYDVTRTLGHWTYVRKGELKHIIPYIYTVDAVLNSGLPYELPILKTILRGKFPDREYIKTLRLEGRLDAYIRGVRLANLFDSILPYENIDDVDGFSPIREFIGGSKYDLAHND